MRRVLGTVLIGVAVAAAALALLLPTVVVPHSKKTPLDLNITQVSSGPAKLLDASTGQIKNVTLQATRVVKTDSHASDSKNTTVNETLCIVIFTGDKKVNCLPATDPNSLSISTDRVTADRKSAESVHVAKYAENVNGDTSVRHVGLSYKFPIDTKKKTYQFFSPDLEKAYPATYEGTSKIRGLTVYKFVSKTGVQPYKIQGTLPGTYDDTRTVWVEPKTGTIVDGQERQIQTLESGQVALDTTLSFEDSAVKFQSDFAKKKIDALKLAQVWAPLILIVVAIAAAVGAFLLLRRRPGDSGRHNEPVPAGAGVGAGAGYQQGPPDQAPANHDGMTTPFRRHEAQTSPLPRDERPHGASGEADPDDTAPRGGFRPE